jgi:hypothetical protein
VRVQRGVTWFNAAQSSCQPLVGQALAIALDLDVAALAEEFSQPPPPGRV